MRSWVTRRRATAAACGGSNQSDGSIVRNRIETANRYSFRSTAALPSVHRQRRLRRQPGMVADGYGGVNRTATAVSASDERRTVPESSNSRRRRETVAADGPRSKRDRGRRLDARASSRCTRWRLTRKPHRADHDGGAKAKRCGHRWRADRVHSRRDGQGMSMSCRRRKRAGQHHNETARWVAEVTDGRRSTSVRPFGTTRSTHGRRWIDVVRLTRDPALTKDLNCGDAGGPTWYSPAAPYLELRQLQWEQRARKVAQRTVARGGL